MDILAGMNVSVSFRMMYLSPDSSQGAHSVIFCHLPREWLVSFRP